MLRTFLLGLSSLTMLACSAPPLQPDLGAELSHNIAELQQQSGVDGLAVVAVSGNEVVLSQGFGHTQSGDPFTADTSCGLYSATKAITAFTLASLVEDGVVDVEKNIGQVWADAPEHWASIPLWRLYNHTSGIPMIVNQPVFAERAGQPEFGNEDIIRIVAEQPLDYQPGEFSRYRQSGYGLAEWLAGRSTSQPWPELVESHLTQPAGATSTQHTQTASAEKSVPMLTSAGGYETTANDMGAIFLALNSGKVARKQSLSTLLLNPSYVHDNYGLGLIHESVLDQDTVGHRGGGARGNIRYAPEAEVGVMVCTDQLDNKELIISVADTVMKQLLK